MSEQFGQDFWEERYAGDTHVWSGRPNPQLVAEAGDLTPGTALDAGCGEGADAVWLASRGWRVTAVDFAATALRRAREHAETFDADAAGRIDWLQADLTAWAPPEQRFDLVSTHYVHLAGERAAFFRRMAAAVAPGGSLLVVGHHPSDLETTVGRPPLPELFFTAEDVVACLDSGRWDVVAAEARPRPATDPDGNEVTVHDTVLRAVRRR
ncbi:class I SAM-dependent methyltransferase [Actinoallomurus rhizosphaericola]|uniref:class I SAM-dependent methyltransferase n=1 Tax=Actinoallomurus rhizosphaericola TaxID=2952536 RepID=UPI0020919528|nr:class I SAM-dependent methyltransferase [Actinoallomurus rhizosphaericola]MCO5993396.1 class I SAM-dependent methyltransferase [Actinoallomurus rhizosphaericola]